MSVKKPTLADKGGVLQVSQGYHLDVADIWIIAKSEGQTAKRFRDMYAQGNRLLDFTQGKKMRSMVFTHGGKLLLSPFSPNNLLARLEEFFIKKEGHQA